MSALPPKADILIVGIDVCYVPIADIRSLRAGHLFGKNLLNARSGHARAALSSDRIVGSVDGGDLFSRERSRAWCKPTSSPW